MLTHLNISNFAITERIDLIFDQGMTVITGETGAGKSITLDGLSLALGARAGSRVVGPHADRAEIHAAFDIRDNPAALDWFDARELSRPEEVLLRRVIYVDGKSRAYINGKPATLQDLRSLSATLVDIHGQHDHQSLHKRDSQRQLLDAYAGTEQLSRQLVEQVREVRHLERTLETLNNQDQEHTARLQLLRYQVDELDQLDPSADELARLESEQRSLAAAAETLAISHEAQQLCCDEQRGATHTLLRASRLLEQLPQQDASLQEAWQLLDGARIQTEEAEHILQTHIANVDINPDRLAQVEERLSSIYEIARKHKVPAAKLAPRWQVLSEELATIDGSETKITELESRLSEAAERRDRLAAGLSRQRQEAAQSLSDAVNALLQQLSMSHCHFNIELTPLQEPGLHGNEQIEFLIGAGPGQRPQAIQKIASGGELSRIGLAIQVAASHTSGTPTLIFDEVDAGIGGGVAEIVGNLLHRLGRRCQVFCITHLPQVACQGDHHFRVAKQAREDNIMSEINQLKNSEKVHEIARMLGGVAITRQTLAHAEEMLGTRH